MIQAMSFSNSGPFLMKFAGPISRHFTSSSITNSGKPMNRRSRLGFVKELHAHYIRTLQHKNQNLMSQIIKSYALSQTSMREARLAFIEIDQPTMPIWNHMIRGLSQSESPVDALDLFDQMRQSGWPGDNLTFIFLCKACARVSDIEYGKRVHAQILKLGFCSYLYVCNALIHMYGSCGDLGFSRKVFEEIEEKDLVSWNSLICGYSQCAKYGELIRLFDEMTMRNVKADAVTMVKVVLACNYLGEWERLDSVMRYIDDNHVRIDVYLGNTLIDVYGSRGLITLARGVFDRMAERNVVSWNVMITGTAKSGDLVEAKKLFDAMPERDVVSWTSMITGYTQAKNYNDAIMLFQDMMVTDVKPDAVTIASMLSTCAHLGRLDVGYAVHEYICKHRVISDIFVENSLIDMYCKCGSVEKALTVFDEMKRKDSVSWTSVICGLAMNGESDRALELFSKMIGDGIRPIHGTFIGVLLACVHAGLVDKGLEFFYSMQKDYELVPEIRHYGCMVDLFCRAGDLHRAYEFILHMPVVSDVVWRMLLSACNLHGNIALAKIASNKLLELDPANGGNYALSSNAYANAEKWDDAIKMRRLIDDGVALKPSGWSSIERVMDISGYTCRSREN